MRFTQLASSLISEAIFKAGNLDEVRAILKKRSDDVVSFLQSYDAGSFRTADKTIATKLEANQFQVMLDSINSGYDAKRVWPDDVTGDAVNVAPLLVAQRSVTQVGKLTQSAMKEVSSGFQKKLEAKFGKGEYTAIVWNFGKHTGEFSYTLQVYYGPKFLKPFASALAKGLKGEAKNPSGTSAKTGGSVATPPPAPSTVPAQLIARPNSSGGSNRIPPNTEFPLKVPSMWNFLTKKDDQSIGDNEQLRANWAYYFDEAVDQFKAYQNKIEKITDQLKKSDRGLTLDSELLQDALKINVYADFFYSITQNALAQGDWEARRYSSGYDFGRQRERSDVQDIAHGLSSAIERASGFSARHWYMNAEDRKKMKDPVGATDKDVISFYIKMLGSRPFDNWNGGDNSPNIREFRKAFVGIKDGKIQNPSSKFEVYAEKLIKIIDSESEPLKEKVYRVTNNPEIKGAPLIWITELSKFYDPYKNGIKTLGPKDNVRGINLSKYGIRYGADSVSTGDEPDLWMIINS